MTKLIMVEATQDIESSPQGSVLTKQAENPLAPPPPIEPPSVIGQGTKEHREISTGLAVDFAPDPTAMQDNRGFIETKVQGWQGGLANNAVYTSTRLATANVLLGAEEDPDFEPLEYAKTHYPELLEEYGEWMIGAKSSDQMHLYATIIDDTQNRQQMLAGSGFLGHVMGFASGFVDADVFLPMGALVKIKKTAGILETTGKTAAAGAAGGVAVAGAAELTQPHYTREDAIFDVAGGTILGGILGGVSGAIRQRMTPQAYNDLGELAKDDLYNKLDDLEQPHEVLARDVVIGSNKEIDFEATKANVAAAISTAGAKAVVPSTTLKQIEDLARSDMKLDEFERSVTDVVLEDFDYAQRPGLSREAVRAEVAGEVRDLTEAVASGKVDVREDALQRLDELTGGKMPEKMRTRYEKLDDEWYENVNKLQGEKTLSARQTAAGHMKGRLGQLNSFAGSFLTPVGRFTKSIFNTGQVLGMQLTHGGVRREFHSRGVAAESDVQTLIGVQGARLGEANDKHRKIYKRYVEAVKNGKLGKDPSLDMNSKRLSEREFSRRVGVAMRNKDGDTIPFVADAAKMWRATVFDPLKKQAIEMNLLPADVTPETADSYFHRMYDIASIMENRAEWNKIVTTWLNDVLPQERDALIRRVDEDLHRHNIDLSKAEEDAQTNRIARRANARRILKERQAKEEKRVQKTKDALQNEIDEAKFGALLEGEDVRRFASSYLKDKQALFGSWDVDSKKMFETRGIEKLIEGDGDITFGKLLEQVQYIKRSLPKPISAREYLRRNGGVYDSEGFLDTMGFKATDYPGLLRKQKPGAFAKDRPKSMDEALEILAAEGYMGPSFDPQDYDLNDLEVILRRDVMERNVYNEEGNLRVEAIEAQENAIRELEDLGAEYGLDYDLTGDNAVRELKQIEQEYKKLIEFEQIKKGNKLLNLADIAGKKAAKEKEKKIAELKRRLDAINNKDVGQLAVVKQARERLERAEELDYTKTEQSNIDRINERITKAEAKREGIEDEFADIPRLAREITSEITDKITGAVTHTQIPLFLSPELRGALKERTFHIPDRYIDGSQGGASFLNNDVRDVAMRYSKNMSAEVELKRKFGSTRFEVIFDESGVPEEKRILEARTLRKQAAGEITNKQATKQLTKIKNEFNQLQRDARFMYENLRGTYKGGVDNPNSAMSYALRAARLFNYVTLLGMRVFSSLPELAMKSMQYNVMRVGGTALNQTISAVKREQGTVPAAARDEIRQAGIALQHQVLNAHASLMEMGAGHGLGNKIDIFSQNASNLFGKASLGNAFDNIVQSTSGVLSQTYFLRAIQKEGLLRRKFAPAIKKIEDDYAKRKIDANEFGKRKDELQAKYDAEFNAVFTKGDVEKLARNGLGRKERDAIFRYHQKHGYTEQDIEFSGIDDWGKWNDELQARRDDINKRLADRQIDEAQASQEGAKLLRDFESLEADADFAKRAINAAIRKEASGAFFEAGDIPIWATTEWGKVIFQFRSFLLITNRKILQAGLLDEDANFLMGFMTMTALGMAGYTLKQLAAGRELSDNPMDYIYNGIDQAALLSMFLEVNNVAEKAGIPGITKMLGINPSARYESRNAIGAVLGPTFGRTDDILRTAHGIGLGDFSTRDVHRIRSFAPGQNLWQFNWLLNKVEDAVPASEPVAQFSFI